MILCPDGWHEWRAGDALVYTPRSGHVHCVMTYAPRRAPLRSLPAVLHDVLAEDRDFELASKQRIVRFVTDEGEYGASIVAKGTFRGQPIAHVVACVFAEDFYTRLDARVELPYLDEHAPLVLALARGDRLGLGVRRRRVGFTPPKGWHPIPGLDLDITLLPPGYPAPHASITMYAAEPRASGILPHLRQREHDTRVGLMLVAESHEVAATTAWKQGKPLKGDEWRTVLALPGGQGKLVRFLVVLQDDRYVYATKLEALEGEPQLDELHTTLLQVMGSIEAIPLPVDARGAVGSILDIWSD